MRTRIIAYTCAHTEMLPTNHYLRRLDVSRNIKLGSLGLTNLSKGLRDSERSGLTVSVLESVI